MPRLIACLAALLLLASIAQGARQVVIDKEKLRDLTHRLGVASLLEEDEDVMADMDELLASPEDIANGDYEIQCRTDCDFAPSDDPDFATGGKAALLAAQDLAVSQAALKKVLDQLNMDPENEELLAEREKFELDVRQKTHVLQVAAGASVSNTAGEVMASTLEASRTQLHNLEQKLQETPDDAKMLRERDTLQRVIAAKEKALKEAAVVEQEAAGVAAEVESLRDRVEKLQEEQAENPENKGLQEELAQVEAQLQGKQAKADALVPRKECYNVCMGQHGGSSSRRLLAETQGVENCVRMCVKVMRQLVYNMGRSFL
mmetsp:Transcript_21983/g.70766  ORF Transcript_21983/g.70766 Transcript_21983/m.70766 type:complete len:317 (-) Transcript_21983:148-1098(-)